MQNHKLFLWIGIILFVLPFLGIRQSLKNILLFIAGAVLIGIALMIRHQVRAALRGSSERVFMENLSVPESAPVLVSEQIPDAITEDESYEEMPMRHTFDSVDESTHATSALYEEIANNVEQSGDTFDADEDVTQARAAVEEKVEPTKKLRKKRITKKPTIQAEMDEPVVVSEEIAQMIDEIDQTLNADRE
jgi:hypothetical protein